MVTDFHLSLFTLSRCGFLPLHPPVKGDDVNPRRFIVLVMFFFMLLRQTDMLMINSMLKPIKGEFGINESQMGFVMSSSLLAAAVLHPL
jgi:predicted MFS family arabinose efflux permease